MKILFDGTKKVFQKYTIVSGEYTPYMVGFCEKALSGSILI